MTPARQDVTLDFIMTAWPRWLIDDLAQGVLTPDELAEYRSLTADAAALCKEGLMDAAARFRESQGVLWEILSRPLRLPATHDVELDGALFRRIVFGGLKSLPWSWDDGYYAGDSLRLAEVSSGKRTGRQAVGKVTDILRDGEQLGLRLGTVLVSLEIEDRDRVGS